MSTEPSPGSEAIWNALRTVNDPEAGENIVDLGLVYRVEVSETRVEVDLTMTTPACPAAGSIAHEAEQAIAAALADRREVRVQVVFDPPWTPERMSAQARARFGWSN